MDLQSGSQNHHKEAAGLAKSEFDNYVMIFKIIFAICTVMLIPLIKLIIRKRWYRQIFTILVALGFPFLGLMIGGIVAEEMTNFNDTIILSIAGIGALIGLIIAIPTIRKMWRYYRRNDRRSGWTKNKSNPANPTAPTGMYDD